MEKQYSREDYEYESHLIIQGYDSIGRHAFSQSNLLEKVVIIDTEVSFESFCDCVSLHTVEIQGNVDSIRGRAFARCLTLTDVTMSDSTNAADVASFGCRPCAMPPRTEQPSLDRRCCSCSGPLWRSRAVGAMRNPKVGEDGNGSCRDLAAQ